MSKHWTTFLSMMAQVNTFAGICIACYVWYKYGVVTITDEYGIKEKVTNGLGISAGLSIVLASLTQLAFFMVICFIAEKQDNAGKIESLNEIQTEQEAIEIEK